MKSKIQLDVKKLLGRSASGNGNANLLKVGGGKPVETPATKS